MDLSSPFRPPCSAQNVHTCCLFAAQSKCNFKYKIKELLTAIYDMCIVNTYVPSLLTFPLWSAETVNFNKWSDQEKLKEKWFIVYQELIGALRLSSFLWVWATLHFRCFSNIPLYRQVKNRLLQIHHGVKTTKVINFKKIQLGHRNRGVSSALN